MIQINEEDKNLLEKNRWKAAKHYSLTHQQLSWVYDKKLFKLWVPKSFGGLEMDFLEGLHTIENLAYEDGSLAWTVTLCSGANLFIGFIDESQHTLFNDREICLGGSGFNSGVAEKNEKGYRIKGEWKYATGAHHLTHFTLVAEIWQNKKPVLDKNGKIKTAAFFVDKKDVEIIEDWQTFGLESTASHSFTVDNVQVDKHREFHIEVDQIRIDHPLYSIPFAFFAEATLLVNYIGMFRKFLDLTEVSFTRRPVRRKVKTESSKKAEVLNAIKRKFNEDSEEYFDLVENIWEQKTYGEEICIKSNNLAKEIVRFIKEKTAFLIPYCGIYAAQIDSEINSVFRNIFTASQHSLLLKEI